MLYSGGSPVGPSLGRGMTQRTFSAPQSFHPGSAPKRVQFAWSITSVPTPRWWPPRQFFLFLSVKMTDDKITHFRPQTRTLPVLFTFDPEA